MDPDVYSGIVAKGSLHAAYLAATEIEVATIAGFDIAGFSFNLPKAFDRIPRHRLRRDKSEKII